VRRLGEPHDVYAVGALFYYLLTGKHEDVDHLSSLVNLLQQDQQRELVPAALRRDKYYLGRRNAIPADHIVSHAAISKDAAQGAHSDPVGVSMDDVRARVAAGLGSAPGQLQWAKIVWAMEQSTRILEREGFQAEAAYVANTYTAAAKKKRDRSS
jgi:hypothetical protein